MQEIEELAAEFRACRKILLALGDANRQHLMLVMMQMKECNGVRVGDITAKTNLSRPAVSHHLAILKDAGIVKLRREGTKNYYYFDIDSKALATLLKMLTDAQEMMKSLPDRSGKEE